ncbi:MAG: hemerythrin family protein [Pirellulales bacterium]|nr:hemerythrin family protein [Pirellulales bacterium]
MAYLWTPALATGVAEVDQQHQELFRQVNALADAMRQGEGKGSIEQTLDFLANYALQHFASEEQHMSQMNCPAAAENKKAHDQFLAKFREMREKLDTSGVSSTLAIEMHDFLGNWLVNHIQKIDCQLQPCAAGAR